MCRPDTDLVARLARRPVLARRFRSPTEGIGSLRSGSNRAPTLMMWAHRSISPGRSGPSGGTSLTGSAGSYGITPQSRWGGNGCRLNPTRRDTDRPPRWAMVTAGGMRRPGRRHGPMPTLHIMGPEITSRLPHAGGAGGETATSVGGDDGSVRCAPQRIHHGHHADAAAAVSPGRAPSPAPGDRSEVARRDGG